MGIFRHASEVEVHPGGTTLLHQGTRGFALSVMRGMAQRLRNVDAHA